MCISEKSSNFAAEYFMFTNLFNMSVVRLGSLLLVVACFVGCTNSPQQVRRLNGKTEVDSLELAQLYFNMQMTNAADRQCLDYVKADTNEYTMDIVGFWYYKVLKNPTDTLKKGEIIDLHIQVYELNDSLVADVKESFTVGSNDLPVAVNRSLLMMCRGEQMHVITPWYVAYGVEGTSLISPYTNLKIILTLEE